MTATTLRKILISIFLMTTTMGNHCSDFGHHHDEDEEREPRLTRASLVASGRASGETVVRAALRSDAGDVRLEESESLRAMSTPLGESVTTAQVLAEERRPSGTTYQSTLSGNATGTLVEVVLDRSATKGVVARDSIVALPTTFELLWVTSPVTREPAALDFSRSSEEGRYVLWEPYGSPHFEEGDELGYAVTGDCIRSLRGEVDWQNGEDSLQLTGTLRDRNPTGKGTACVIEVELSLRRRGHVDPLFGDGSFLAEQVRKLQILARP